MVRDISETSSIKPKNDRLLGEIRVDPTIKQPLGGINPYSPHFDTIGNSFLKLLIEHAKLDKKHKVLDIGCGTGRLAKQMCGFLDGGTYDGFDVNQHFIDYCQETYTTEKFSFKKYDVRHDEYNPNGGIDPLSFTFPYTSNNFDLVCAIAVFNHFEASWIYHYISEMARVVKQGGTLFFTCLILNQMSIPKIDMKERPPFRFSHRTTSSWHEYEERQLFNVAIPEVSLRREIMRHKLMIREPIRYGEWCGSPVAITGHDVVIATGGTDRRLK